MVFVLCFTIFFSNTHKVYAVALVDDAVVAIVACLLVTVGVIDLSDGEADIVETAIDFVSWCGKKSIDLSSFCVDCVNNATDFYKKGAVALSASALVTFVGWFNSYLYSHNYNVNNGSVVGNNTVISSANINLSSLADVFSSYSSALDINDFISKVNSDRFLGKPLSLLTFTHGNYTKYMLYTLFVDGVYCNYSSLPSSFSSVDIYGYYNLYNSGSFSSGATESSTFTQERFLNQDFTLLGEFYISDTLAGNIALAPSNAILDDTYISDVIDNWGKDIDSDDVNDVVIVGAPVNADGDLFDDTWQDKMIGAVPGSVIDIPWDIPGDIPTDVPTDTPVDTGWGWLDTLINSIKALLQSILDVIKALPGAIADAIFGDFSNINFDNFKLNGSRLSNVFPFCIPWDLIAFFTCLCADPVAPVFTYDFSEQFGFDFCLTVDFSDSRYSVVFDVVRWGSLLFFILGLILITRNIIRG